MSERLLTDQDLISSMKSGDHKAFEELYGRYWPEVYTMIYRRIGDREITKDIVQDIFINLWRYRDRIIAERSLAPWLNVIAKKQAISWYRKQVAGRQRDQLYQENEAIVVPPTTALETKELQDLLDREIDQMPVNMKLSFRLSRYENKSIKEIAAELSLSEQTVRNNISMALERLRLQTRKFYAEPANLAVVIVVLLINT
ncbi:MAG: sigma-70 family RNA polymerase sigma factor [Pedobacter sp.]|uniref:RNA polymerase sigma factor n=1 Tax=Pedobacter sp. TaxID=1411316 RepID=UPI003561BCFA